MDLVDWLRALGPFAIPIGVAIGAVWCWFRPGHSTQCCPATAWPCQPTSCTCKCKPCKAGNCAVVAEERSR